MTSKVKKFKFGDKVHDWLWYQDYIVMKKTRGDYYIVIDHKSMHYKIYGGRLKKGWKKK